MGGPAPILRLEESVVHRIAAGEVIQRPASALKEMIENSIDAGAKHVTVVIKEGGLRLLQIQDDGHGVRYNDLPLLCQRHATSKLRRYEDLETIGTLGFRGEALASISYVAHMSVTTMTEGLQHGYRVQYRDGEIVPPGPKPTAAVKGTSITVEVGPLHWLHVVLLSALYRQQLYLLKAWIKNGPTAVRSGLHDAQTTVHIHEHFRRLFDPSSSAWSETDQAYSPSTSGTY